MSEPFRIVAPSGNGLAVDQVRADSGLFRTFNNSGVRNYRHRPGTLSRRDPSPLNSFEWVTTVKLSRGLYAANPLVAAAINDKADYAVGSAWEAQYLGADKEWGNAAEAWLRNEWYPLADDSGLDFQASLRLSCISMDMEGDDLAIFSRTRSGFPVIRHVSAPQIGSRTGDGQIKEGKYKGATMQNGIIRNRFGRTIAYQILGKDQKDDFTVSSQNAHFLYQANWRNQRRGIPALATPIMDLMDAEDIRSYTKAAVKLASSIGLLHSNETGQPDDVASYISADTAAANTTKEDLRVEAVGDVGTHYLVHGKENISALNDSIPSPNREEFVARLEKGILAGLGWAYELLFPSKVGGAPMRSIQDKARNSVRQRQGCLDKRARREVQFAISSAMESDRLPRNEGDWWKWGFTKPKTLTVDEGHDHKKDIEDLRAGIMTKAAYVAKHTGQWWEDVDAQSLTENKALIDRAMDLIAHAADRGQTLPLEGAIDLLQQRGPNPASLNIAP